MGSIQQVLLARPDLLRVGAVFSSFIVLASILRLHFHLISYRSFLTLVRSGVMSILYPTVAADHTTR